MAMTHSDTIDVLNRVLAVLYRSLPVYLQGAKPWTPNDGRRALDALARIAEDQQRYSQRVAAAILQEDGQIAVGQFPLEFTAIHDLALDYLVKRVAQSQRRDIEIIRECVAALADASALRVLAEEILGNAEGHLETLEEIMMNDE